ncbi:tyrosine-type recombinase/integrase, partial [Paralimibaculum aggregatum]|uniref:tyrosine-type recombinase/integrase n=1 Tax=Paralimibaculum aggregatum TaxID=3036245 RepID=UPI003D9FF2F3
MARTVYAGLLPTWKPGGVHVRHWIASLERHVFPTLGQIPIVRITRQDIARVLQAIRFERPETARRVRQRLRAIMARAKANEKYAGETPVEIASGGLADNRPEGPDHHPALPRDALPGAMQAPAAQDSVSGLALRFITLPAVRLDEGRGACWGEIDRETRIWTVPTARMKTRRDHRVPSSAAALEVLEDARGLDDGPIFPGQRSGKPRTDVAVTRALRRAGRDDCSARGMRSTFRDWAWEQTGTPREIAELCLAHQVGNA